MNYAQENAVKGMTFASLHEQNVYLRHWEATVADTRIHGTTRRQVQQHFETVERAAMLPLPVFQKKYKVYLTVANMAELVKAKVPSIYEWISRGLLNSCTSRIGGNINIMLTCLLAMIARGKLNTSIRSAMPESPEPPGEIRIETEYV